MNWHLPSGAKAGETKWPAPERKVLDGDLLDYVFHKRLTLVTPVTIPADASGEVEISVDLEWLVCKDVCVAGSTALSLTLAVASDAKAGAKDDASLIAQAKKEWPVALPSSSKELQHSWEDGQLVFVVQGAKHLAFSPLALGAKLLSPLDTGASKGSSLRLKFEQVKPTPGLPLTAEQGSRARGVLRVEKAGGVVTNYAVDLPLPVAGTGTPVPRTKAPAGANNDK
jgi:thiol:disulfide interchange protein DsbD